MPEQTVKYAISTDFGSGVDPTRLDMEIFANPLSVVLLRIETDGDVCSITFSDTLTGQDQTGLGMPPTPDEGTLIGDHGGTELLDVRDATFCSSGASPGSTGTAVTVPFNSSIPNVGDAISPYSLTSNVVTLTEAGVYALIAEATVEVSVVGTVRTIAESLIEVDTGGGFGALSGSRSRACFAGTVLNEPDSVASTLIAELAAGDKVRMRLNRISGDAIVRTVADQSRLTILALRRD